MENNENASAVLPQGFTTKNVTLIWEVIIIIT